MNIAFFQTKTNLLTGASLASLETASLLKLIPANVTIFSTHKPSYPWEINKLPIGNELNWVKLKRKKSIKAKTDPKLYKHLISYIKSKFENIINTDRYDITNYHISVINSIGSHDIWENETSFNKIKSVLIVRECPNLYILDKNKPRIEKIIQKIKMHSNIIYASNSAKTQWESYPELSSIKSHVIRFGINENIVSKKLLKKSANKNKIRKKLEMPVNKFIIVIVGTIKYIKGQDLVLNNIDILAKHIPDCKIYFIGRKNSKWATRILKKARKSIHKQNIVYLGERTNALEYIYASDALMLPSRTDTLPRVVKEAMLLKTPVIAARVDGVPELIEDQKGGMLFDPNDINEMINKLVYLKNNKEKTKMFVNYSYKKYWKELSTKNNLKNIKNVFKTI